MMPEGDQFELVRAIDALIQEWPLPASSSEWIEMILSAREIAIAQSGFQA